MMYGPKCFYEARAYREPSFPQARQNLLTHVKPEPRPVASMAEAIATLAEPGDIPEPPLHDILSAVSAVTGIAMVDLISTRRERRYVRARFVYYHVARTLTSKSTPNIGRHCGLRDHTTVLHGLHMVKIHPADYAEAINAVTTLLTTRCSVYGTPENHVSAGV